MEHDISIHLRSSSWTIYTGRTNKNTYMSHVILITILQIPKQTSKKNKHTIWDNAFVKGEENGKNGNIFSMSFCRAIVRFAMDVGRNLADKMDNLLLHYSRGKQEIQPSSAMKSPS